MKRVHVFLSGTVQGVFFRDSARKEAEVLGVTGWIRNMPDGRVEGVFEGEPRDVDALVRWCHDGPPNAAVDDVRLEEEPSMDSFEGFQVVR